MKKEIDRDSVKGLLANMSIRDRDKKIEDLQPKQKKIKRRKYKSGEFQMTVHCQKRLVERYNISELKAQKKIIKNAWKKGEDIPNEMCQFFFYRSQEIPDDTVIKFHENKVWIFSIKESVPKLITIFVAKGGEMDNL